MKIVAFPLFSLLLVGCGTINTTHDGLDAIYNTTSAVIKANGNQAECSSGHYDDKKKCKSRSQAKTNAISELISKHRSDSET